MKWPIVLHKCAGSLGAWELGSMGAWEHGSVLPCVCRPVVVRSWQPAAASRGQAEFTSSAMPDFLVCVSAGPRVDETPFSSFIVLPLWRSTLSFSCFLLFFFETHSSVFGTLSAVSSLMLQIAAPWRSSKWQRNSIHIWEAVTRVFLAFLLKTINWWSK